MTDETNTPLAYFDGVRVSYSFDGTVLLTTMVHTSKKVAQEVSRKFKNSLMFDISDRDGNKFTGTWPITKPDRAAYDSDEAYVDAVEHSRLDAAIWFADRIGADLVDQLTFADRLVELGAAHDIEVPKFRSFEEVEAAKRFAKQPGADGLPKLTGTEKQIAFATKIREAFASRHPGDVALKRGKTAKYWIENHRSVLYR